MAGSSSSMPYRELPPGPEDRSVLYLQPHHRSGNESLMEGVEIISLCDHSSKLKDIDFRDPRLEQNLRRSGFYSAMHIDYIRLDRHLITALCDRWRPETNTFHFRVGEMTVTLADVHYLFGLASDGYPVCLQNMDYDYIEMCADLLGLFPPRDAVKSKTELSMTWFKNEFSEPLPQDANAQDILRRSRAVILYFLSCRLFPDHSKGRLNLKFLPFLNNLNHCGQYAWGSAVLCCLYRELSDVAVQKRKVLGGSATLLQLWSWSHIAIGRPNVQFPRFVAPPLPWGGRWNSARSWKETPKNVQFYRNELDLLPDESVTWEPYRLLVDFNTAGPVQYMFSGWIASKGRFILFLDFELYAPDRVMRQFGFTHQHIPDPVVPLDPEPSSWWDYLEESIALWNSRVDRAEQERNPPVPLSEYEYWYWQITRRYILKSSARNLVAYIPRAPLQRDVVSGIYSALEVVDEIEGAIDPEPEKAKAKCIDLRRILDTILGRNKLRRPARPLRIVEEQPRVREEPHKEVVEEEDTNVEEGGAQFGYGGQASQEQQWQSLGEGGTQFEYGGQASQEHQWQSFGEGGAQFGYGGEASQEQQWQSFGEGGAQFGYGGQASQEQQWPSWPEPVQQQIQEEIPLGQTQQQEMPFGSSYSQVPSSLPIVYKRKKKKKDTSNID